RRRRGAGRSAGRGHGGPAAARLQARGRRAHGPRRQRRRRRRGRDHPQGAAVRAPLRGGAKAMAPAANTSKDARAGQGHGMAGLVVAAIGVVFGDIGTSPLYTIKQAIGPHYGLAPTHDTVIGLLSLVFWALTLVVTIKYVTIIMRADNEGEGGIMALMTLA